MLLNEKRQDEFFVFDIDYDGSSFNITPVKAKLPNDEVLYLIGPELEYIYNLDIKYFSFTIFEEDFDNLSDSEFEYLWNKFFIPWIEMLSERYLDIDIDKFKFQLNRSERKFLVKKIIHFVMMFLPYIVLKKILLKYNIETKAEALDLLEYFKENPGELRKLINNIINETVNNFNNILDTIKELSKYAKKNQLEDSYELLDSQIKKQNYYIEIFQEILDNTEIDKIIELFKKYIENDFENLI